MQLDCREEENRSAREATYSAVQSVMCCIVSPANLAVCEAATAEAAHQGGQVGVAGQPGPAHQCAVVLTLDGSKYCTHHMYSG